jgi:biopolymer transport protein TolR
MSFSGLGGSGQPHSTPMAEINTTPLVDVMLVLLIIFMITAPLLAKGVKVNLPQAKAAQTLNQKDPIVVTIGKDGKVSLGSDATTLDALVDGVRTLMGDDLTRVVHVRGDNDAVYGEVVKVMDKLANNGITHIAIMTNSRKQAEPAGSDAAGSGSAAPPAATAPTSAPAPVAAPAPAAAPSAGGKVK